MSYGKARRFLLDLKMVTTCKLAGGLGNQLFQIAETIARDPNNFAFNLENWVSLGQGDCPESFKTTLYKNMPLTSTFSTGPISFVQNYENWAKHEQKIKSLLSLELVPSNNCVIHFRGGDYLSHARFSRLNKYYELALQKIPKAVTKCVVTDDYSLATETFLGQKTYISYRQVNRYEISSY